MINPFSNLPLNTQQIYVMGVSSSSKCEVYIPVADWKQAGAVKNNLQNWLDAQLTPEATPIESL